MTLSYLAHVAVTGASRLKIETVLIRALSGQNLKFLEEFDWKIFQMSPTIPTIVKEKGVAPFMGPMGANI